jgi:hypothetical protein
MTSDVTDCKQNRKEAPPTLWPNLLFFSSLLLVLSGSLSSLLSSLSLRSTVTMSLFLSLSFSLHSFSLAIWPLLSSSVANKREMPATRATLRDLRQRQAAPEAQPVVVEEEEEEEEERRESVGSKTLLGALVLWLCGGALGLHHFYLHRPFQGAEMIRCVIGEIEREREVV